MYTQGTANQVTDTFSMDVHNH